MRDDTNQEKAVLNYAAAHAAHYKAKDLNTALELYSGVMTSHPDTPEAGYSRTQIQNIAKSVVPRQALLDAEKQLIRVHLEKNATLPVERAPEEASVSAGPTA